MLDLNSLLNWFIFAILRKKLLYYNNNNVYIFTILIFLNFKMKISFDKDLFLHPTFVRRYFLDYYYGTQYITILR